MSWRSRCCRWPRASKTSISSRTRTWRWGGPCTCPGELTALRTHSEQGIALYDPQQHPRSPFFMDDPRVAGLSLAAWALWYLGYPDQALQAEPGGPGRGPGDGSPREPLLS